MQCLFSAYFPNTHPLTEPVLEDDPCRNDLLVPAMVIDVDLSMLPVNVPILVVFIGDMTEWALLEEAVLYCCVVDRL